MSRTVDEIRASGVAGRTAAELLDDAAVLLAELGRLIVEEEAEKAAKAAV